MGSCAGTALVGSFRSGFTDEEPLPPMAAAAFCLSMAIQVRSQG
jgi:hypothetical protein